MYDKYKWSLIKCSRRESYLRGAGECPPYTAHTTEPVPRGLASFSPPLKRLFLLPAFVSLVVHMASQVYSRGLKGAIVTLSSLESLEWRQWHPSELHGAITLTGGSPERPGEVT